MVIYAGYSLLGAIRRDGSLLLLLMDGSGRASLGRQGRDGGWSEPLPATIPTGTRLGPGALLDAPGSAVLDFYYPDAQGELRRLSSVNDGKDWNEGGNWT